MPFSPFGEWLEKKKVILCGLFEDNQGFLKEREEDKREFFLPPTVSMPMSCHVVCANMRNYCRPQKQTLLASLFFYSAEKPYQTMAINLIVWYAQKPLKDL